MILLRSQPTDYVEATGYTSKSVIFAGLYPERSRCKAVDEQNLPPPPMKTSFVFTREEAMMLTWSDSFSTVLELE